MEYSSTIKTRIFAKRIITSSFVVQSKPTPHERIPTAKARQGFLVSDDVDGIMLRPKDEPSPQMKRASRPILPCLSLSRDQRRIAACCRTPELFAHAFRNEKARP